MADTCGVFEGRDVALTDDDGVQDVTGCARPSVGHENGHGHGTGFDEPSGQKNDAGQRPHPEEFVRPDELLQVPAGQGNVSNDPIGQNEPGGHAHDAPLQRVHV